MAEPGLERILLPVIALTHGCTFSLLINILIPKKYLRFLDYLAALAIDFKGILQTKAHVC